MKKIFGSVAVIALSLAAASAQAVVREGLNDPGRREVEKVAVKRNKETGRRDARVLRLGPSATYLKNGLRLNEVVSLLGKPASISERNDGELRIRTYTFPRSEGRILVAEFENNVLVGSRTEIREEVAQEKESR
ncbi:MAG TPA: hypothetical protein VIW80_04920 [Pyrinomonadaceae bacterium]|jgi:hypothetical protein